MDSQLGVIIPTCRRPAHLRRCLAALCGQTLPAAQVIVVNDGRGRLDILDPPIPLGLTVVESHGIGPTAARNLGLESLAADVEFVGFLDDDSVPALNWVETCQRLFLQFPDVTAQLGKIGWWREENGNGRLKGFWPRIRQKIYDSRHRWYTDAKFREEMESYYGRKLTDGLPGIATHLSCNNAAIRRDFIRAHGPFDQRFRTMSDREMAMRILAQGGIITYNPQMFVEHDHDPSIARAVRRCYRAVPYQKLLASEYKDLGFGDVSRQRAVPLSVKLTLLERAYLVLHSMVQRAAFRLCAQPHQDPLAMSRKR